MSSRFPQRQTDDCSSGLGGISKDGEIRGGERSQHYRLLGLRYGIIEYSTIIVYGNQYSTLF